MIAEEIKLKICHVITRMNIGGAEENTLLTCQGLARRGHDVTLVTGPSIGLEGSLLACSDLSGITVIQVPELRRDISLMRDRRVMKTLQELFENSCFDVVHTHMSKAGILGRLAAKAAGVPMIVHTVHGQAFHPYQNCIKNWLFKMAERKAAKVSNRIFAVAEAMIEQCVEAKIAPRTMYRVVYSGMNLDAFVNVKPNPGLKRRFDIPDDCAVVGTVARIFPQKGYEDLLKAAPLIIKAYPKVRFLIVGDGAMRDSFQKKLQAAGIAQYFVFTGMVPPSEVPVYLASMDVVLHLSLHEGLPRTVVQAFAAKVPVVAYPVDGTPEVVDSGKNGFLAEVHDVKKVAEYTVTLLKNAPKRATMGHLGQEKVLRKFDSERMVDVLEEEYYRGLRGVKPGLRMNITQKIQ